MVIAACLQVILVQLLTDTTGQVRPARVFVRLVGLQEGVEQLCRPGADKHCCQGGVLASAGQVGPQGAQEGVVGRLVPGFVLYSGFCLELGSETTCSLSSVQNKQLLFLFSA